MSKYVNPIDNVIRDLEYKRQCIINAYNSGEFCDNMTSKHNIEVLTKGIIAMKRERCLYIIENSIIYNSKLKEGQSMKRYRCTQVCPELDVDISRHCEDTLEGIRSREECGDYCPCGNTPIWEEIEEKEADQTGTQENSNWNTTQR